MRYFAILFVMGLTSGCVMSDNQVYRDKKGNPYGNPSFHLESVRKVGDSYRGTINIGGTRIGF